MKSRARLNETDVFPCTYKHDFVETRHKETLCDPSLFPFLAYEYLYNDGLWKLHPENI